MSWTCACELDDVLPNAGACALIHGRQIAVFRVGATVFALDNYDPASGANVLSRGLVGDIKGEQVVASPLYKHHYSLSTGRCLEDPGKAVNVYPVRIMDGRIWVTAVPKPAQQLAGAPADGAPATEPACGPGSLPLRKRRLVVIGNGMAGMRTVEELLDLAPATYDITVFGAEPHGNYNRVLLSPLLAGDKRVEEIILHPRSWYEQHGVDLHAGDPVVHIDRRRRLVRSQSGAEASYDRLLIATGSKPIVLPIPGARLCGVVTFRDLSDVGSMLEAAKARRKAIVIGGGLLGLEAASALLHRGMDVTVVHLFDSLMERQLDKSAAALLKASLEARGLKFHMRANTTAILGGEEATAALRGDKATRAPGPDRATGVRLDDGTALQGDLIVMAAGVRPNIELASRAGLQCERGILVDDTLQTFDPAIYAVGECVQHRNKTFGLVAPLWEQARVCAMHLADVGVSRYRGGLTATQLKVTGIDLYSAGEFADREGSEALVMHDQRRGIYKRLVIRDNKLHGAVLYGDVRDGPWYFELMTAGRDITALRNGLLFGPEFVQA